ncbi:hypothetical protein CHKEEEPN_4501 [Methylorubrum podarium]|nr:hypothetical protein CHKEEEPN_4501 [Methylorubrum podarium]
MAGRPPSKHCYLITVMPKMQRSINLLDMA